MEKFALRIICMLISIITFPAWAAPSDNSSPSWSLNNAITHIDELFFFATTYIGIGLLICTAISFTLSKKWLVAFMVLLLTIISYMLEKVFFNNMDFVTQAAMEEHLISPLYATTMALIIMIVLAFGNMKKQFLS